MKDITISGYETDFVKSSDRVRQRVDEATAISADFKETRIFDSDRFRISKTC
jgi:hypothetical protein